MEGTEKRMTHIDKTTIFTEEVYSFTMPNHEKWSKKIKDIILVENNKELHGHTTIPEEACNVKARRTAWDSHFRYPSIGSLTHELAGILGGLIERENFDAPNLRVQDSWINWYEKNNHTVPHHHGNHLSVVYFVDVEDSKADFLFLRQDRFQLVKKEGNKTLHNNIKSVEVKNGSVLVFNGSLTHAVTANLSDSTRITFAVNYAVEYYDEKRNDY